MATPERTPFGPEAQARRERKAAQKARLDASAQAATVDVWSPHASELVTDVLDAGTAEAVATTSERAALRAARGGRAVQGAQRNLAAKKAEVRGQQAAAGKPKSKRPTVDEWLEEMSAGERATIEQSERFQRLSEVAQNYVLRRRALLEDVLEEAEYRAAAELEQQQLAAYEVAEASRYWPEDNEPQTEAERRAEADLAAAVSGPLYAGDPEDVYADDIDETYDLEGEDE